MAINEDYRQLAQELIASGGADDIYTVPASTQAIIKHIVITNPSGGACWVKLWTGGSSNVNLILPQVELGAGEWCEFDGTVTLETGVVLSAQAQTNDVINITVHGIELETV